MNRFINIDTKALKCFELEPLEQEQLLKYRLRRTDFGVQGSHGANMTLAIYYCYALGGAHIRAMDLDRILGLGDHSAFPRAMMPVQVAWGAQLCLI